MQKFIGTKIIMGEAMTNYAFIQQVKNEDIPQNVSCQDGYLVEYKDGYRSWSPEKAFEDAYRPANGMNFGLAMEIMRKGHTVALPHWGDDVSIQMQIPDEHSKMTHPYMYANSRFGKVPWIPTQVEMFSDSWFVKQ